MAEFFMQFFSNKFIIVPIITWFCIQSFKVIYELIETKKFNFKRILGAGGMPSSHTAVAISLTFLVGKEYGFNSAMFAACLIFSFVIMYDAAGVRRAAGKQAAVLNKIAETPGLSKIEVQERLVEALGHTPFEVIVGAIIGVIVGLIF